jgi:hypothetical protein
MRSALFPTHQPACTGAGFLPVAAGLEARFENAVLATWHDMNMDDLKMDCFPPVHMAAGPRWLLV